jgi:hypothetical protein
MKTTLHYLLALLLCSVSALLTTSCSKDSSSTSGGSSDFTLLTTGTWTVQSISYEQSNGTWVTPTPVAGEYSITFGANYYFSQSGSGDFSNNNIWTLNSTGLSLNGGFDNITGQYTITQLTSSTLDITAMNYQNSPGFSYTGERMTFSNSK